MEGQQHIGRTAIDNVVINIGYRLGFGYDVMIQHRRNGGAWADEPRRIYDRLTSDELQAVVAAELEVLFG